jgi:DNA-binding response OmpR family regulator
MRVLVVEDNQDLGAFLKRGLENEGHRVEWLEDGDVALEYSGAEHPDLIVLDIGIRKRDGLEVLRELRAQGSDAGLVVLTDRNELRLRVQCLDFGADDCILKPFSFLEFTARCRALLRRRAQVADPVLRREDLELHRVNRQVFRGGREIALTTKEFALLEYLMLRPGEIISRSELLAQVWKTEENTGTNIVDVYINYLRRKLQQQGTDKLIQTVRGAGYGIGRLVQKDKKTLERGFLRGAEMVHSEPVLIASTIS